MRYSWPGNDMTDLADDFARDGVACVRRVLDAAELNEAAAAIETVLAEPSPLAQVASGPEDPGAFTEDFCRWREVPAIERLARHSRVPAIAAALMRTEQVRFYHDHVLVKEGGTRQRTPLAPRPALLQRRRPWCERVDPGRPGTGRRLPGDRCWHARWAMADAAYVPAWRGQVVPGGQPGRDPRH